MAAEFPLDEAQIISTWMGAVTFGIMLVTFFICIRTLLSSDSALSRISFRVLLGVSIAMAILDGLDKSLQLRHILDAFVYYKGPGGPLGLLNDTRNWVNFTKTVVYVVQTWLGDGVLVYRCCIVYDKRWYGTIPPLILFMSSLAMGSLMIFFTEAEGRGPITGAKLKPIILSFLSLSLAQNVVITVAIALRIYLMQRRMAGSITSTTALNRVKRAVIIIVESGAIYSGSMFILVGSFVSNDVTDYAWSGVASSVIPIAFNLIIIRVHKGRAVDQNQNQNDPKAVEVTTVKFKKYATPKSEGRNRNRLVGTNTVDVDLEMTTSMGTGTELGTESYMMSAPALVMRDTGFSSMSSNTDLEAGKK